MRKVTNDEQKKILLDMLKYLKKICEDNNLKYFLIGGTLLGAVRHKGFIPWDDDIDIIMPRKDYDSLEKILEKKKHKFYKLLTYKQDDYYYVYNKLVDTRITLKEKNLKSIENMGIYLDIFPLDALPKDYDLFAEQLICQYNDFINSRKDGYRTSNYWWKMAIKSIIKYPLYMKNKRVCWKERQLKLINNMKKNSIDDCQKVGFILSAYKKREIFDKNVFESCVMLEFENNFYPAPIGYKKYLESIYGDYMKLPPKSKRKSQHFYKAYWKDN